MIEIFDLAELVPFKNLNELILSGNKLKGFYFRNESNRNFTCKYLKKLDLSLNLIEDVDLNFEIFKNIDYLDLSSNFIFYIQDSNFKLLKNLKTLKLGNNKLIGFDYNILSNKNIEGLYLDNTFGYELNLDVKSLFKQSIIFMSLSDNLILEEDFNLLQNESYKIKELILKNTNLTSLKKIRFEFFPKLEVVDLSGNKLENLNLSQFYSLFSLKKLFLSKTCLKTIDSFEFKKLEQLVVLDLSFNELEIIKKSCFENSTYIRVIDLSYNKITFIESGTFKSLKALAELNLKANSLKIFCMDEFVVSSLRSLTISQNEINYLNFDELNNEIYDNRDDLFYAIDTLDFSFNNLRIFESKYYFKVNKLVHIAINDNQLQNITQATFLYLNQLQDISLSNNLIDYIEPYSFYKLLLLRSLLLDNNKISYLEKYTFHGLFRLQKLDLRNNSIKIIESSYFSDLNSLVYLNLGYNSLQLIEHYSFSNLNQLADLYLNGNTDVNIETKSLDGLFALRNIYLNLNLFLNSTFKLTLKSSIKPRVYKIITSRIYYESLNIIADDHIGQMEECNIIIYFIRNNIQFNLKESSHIKYYEENCESQLKV